MQAAVASGELERIPQALTQAAEAMERIQANEAAAKLAEDIADAREEAEDMVAALEFDAATAGMDAYEAQILETKSALQELVDAQLLSAQAAEEFGRRAEAAIRKTQEETRRASSSIGRELSNAFNQTITGFLEGGRDFDFFQQLEDSGKAAFSRMISSWVDEKLGFDKLFEGNLQDLLGTLVDWGKRALDVISDVFSAQQTASAAGSLGSSGGSTGSTIATGIGVAASLFSAQTGGIMRKTAMGVVHQGEVIMPLEKLDRMLSSHGGGGRGTVINVITPPGMTAKTRRRRRSEEDEIFVMVGEQMNQHWQRRGPGAQGAELAYGLRRQGVRR